MSVLRPESIPALLAELVRTRFWGSIQIDYQDGRALLVRKTETQKVVSESSKKGTPMQTNTPQKTNQAETEIAYVIRRKSDGLFYSDYGCDCASHYQEFTRAFLYDNASDALDGCDGTVEVLKVTCTMRPIVQN